MRPQPTDHAPYYQHYIDLAPGQDLQQAFAIADQLTFKYLDTIPVDRDNYAYAEGKWTVKQLFQHVIDTERIFAYRALCIARGEQGNLPGFDENEYAKNVTGENRSLPELIAEFKAVRETTKMLFQSFTDEDLQRIGTANNVKIKVLALGYIILGHAIHHLNVLKERYLIQSIA